MKQLLYTLFFSLAAQGGLWACSCAHVHGFCRTVSEDSPVGLYRIDSIADEALGAEYFRRYLFVSLIECINGDCASGPFVLVGGNGADCRQILNHLDTQDSLVFSMRPDWIGEEGEAGLSDCEDSYLTYSDGRVYGPLYDALDEMDYAAFKGDIGTCLEVPVPSADAHALALEAGFSLFPNPVRDGLELRSTLAPIRSWSLFDAQGRRLAAAEGLDTWACRLEMGAYPQGLYLLRLQVGDAVLSRRVLLRH